MKVQILVIAAIIAVAVARPQKSEKDAVILRQANDLSPEGAYQYSYETDNGIKADEVGSLVPANDPADGQVVVASGSFSYPGPDGKPIEVRYTAGVDGYKAEGVHLPQ